MKGKELRFILKKAGLTYKQFSKNINKSIWVIQWWVSNDINVPEVHLIPLKKLLGATTFNKLQAEFAESITKQPVKSIYRYPSQYNSSETGEKKPNIPVQSHEKEDFE